VPCTTRPDVTRTARCYFAPCRVQCKGCYRHGTGPFSACLAPTAWILFVRVPCTTRTDIRTARCYFAPCPVQCKGCYRHGTGLFSAFLRQPHGYYSYGCRVQRELTLSARQGVTLPLAGCNVKGVIGTPGAHFLLALRQPHGYYSYGCRVQRGLTLSARQGVILPLAG